MEWFLPFNNKIKQMKVILKLILLSAVLMSSKCGEQLPTIDPGLVNVNYRSFYKSEPLVMNKVYDYYGKKIRFSRFSFFVSDAYTIQIPNNSSLDDYAALIDFTNIDDTVKAKAGVNYPVKNVKSCKCTFTLGLGVDSIQNTKKPKDYPSSNPLSDGGWYWDDWKSYIFSKLEGSIDKDGDGRYETPFTIHTGGNSAFRESNRYNIVFDEADKADLKLTVDVNNLLKEIDLFTVNSTHQTGDLPTMMKFMDNLKNDLK
jgi:hypothetical protein